MKTSAKLSEWDDLEYQLAQLILEQRFDPDTAIRMVCANNRAARIELLILAGSSVAAHFAGGRPDSEPDVEAQALRIHKAVLGVVLDSILLGHSGKPADLCGDLVRYWQAEAAGASTGRTLD